MQQKILVDTKDVKCQLTTKRALIFLHTNSILRIFLKLQQFFFELYTIQTF